MPDQVERFVERLADLLARSGWPRMSARIFARLMATPSGTRTATELVAQLGVGPSAISNGAKLLRALGLADVTRRADRQIAYTVRPDVWMEAVAGQDERLRMLEGVLSEGVRALEGTAAEARLAETAEFFAYLRTELPGIVERWRKTRGTGR